jgi:hypothetical protein
MHLLKELLFMHLMAREAPELVSALEAAVEALFAALAKI